MTSVTDFNDNTVAVTDTADGLPSSLSLGSSGDTVSTTYDPTDSPSAITLTNSSSTTLLGISYSDEPSGAIASETNTPSGSTSPADYVYDAQSRVTAMTPGSGTAHNYDEDASSNLTELPTGASGTYNDASELTSSTLSGTTTNYTYNADGERTQASIGGTTTVSASYNGAQELASYSNALANTTSASYEGGGVRASVTTTPSGGSSSTQHFTWDEAGSNPQLLMDSTNAYVYGPGSTPIEQVNESSGNFEYLICDTLGSVRGVVSSSGSLTASTSYDAWGNPESSGGLTSYTSIGFAGGYTDPTGLIYLVHRYYDPVTGQFVSSDPLIGQTLQPYEYSTDDPVNGDDPTGTFTHYTKAYTWEEAFFVGWALIFGISPLADFIPYVGGIFSGVTAWVGDKFINCSLAGNSTQDSKRIASIRYCQGVEYTISFFGWDTHVPYNFFVRGLNVNHEWLTDF